MTVKMEYEQGNFKETIEIDYRIKMVLLTQKDNERDDLNVVTLLGEQTKDLYILLKDMYK